VTTRRGRPTHDEAKQLDQRVREAAVEIFLESGYAGASMDGIARAAGITRKSLYARYPDKHAVFVDVIPWALARIESDGSVTAVESDDLESDLIAFGRKAIRHATSPDDVRLKRIAMNEAAQFPEFAVAADSMMWAARQRACTELLRSHEAKGNIKVDDAELAAEHFLALVESVPSRLADFGVYRSKRQEERHLQNAVQLFLHGVAPR
jgi:TetR/AcrR family transcriptional repressor of mexJK operon